MAGVVVKVTVPEFDPLADAAATDDIETAVKQLLDTKTQISELDEKIAPLKQKVSELTASIAAALARCEKNDLPVPEIAGVKMSKSVVAGEMPSITKRVIAEAFGDSGWDALTKVRSAQRGKESVVYTIDTREPKRAAMTASTDQLAKVSDSSSTHDKFKQTTVFFDPPHLD